MLNWTPNPTTKPKLFAQRVFALVSAVAPGALTLKTSQVVSDVCMLPLKTRGKATFGEGLNSGYTRTELQQNWELPIISALANVFMPWVSNGCETVSVAMIQRADFNRAFQGQTNFDRRADHVAFRLRPGRF